MSPRWLGPLAIAATFVSLAAWSWGRWTDPQIDFGHELYVAWQLSEGRTLYGDIAARHGPLSHHLNALWFALFGVSLRTLVWANLALLAAIAAMTWRLFRLASDRLTAGVAVAVLLTWFGFSQYVGIANYNFVTPYHHYQTHAIALALAMALACGAALRGAAGPAAAAGAGACLGGIFLTKLELFVPAAAAAGVGAWGIASGRGGRALAAGSAGALAVPALAFAALALRLPAASALAGVLGNWAHLEASPLAEPFYVRLMGIDAPGPNALAMSAACALWAGFAAAALLVDRNVPEGPRRRVVALLGGGATFAALVALPVPWPLLARALPVVAGLACAWILRRAFALRGDPERLAGWLPLAVFAVFAFALLGKVWLRVRFDHYGFALAMPATLLGVASLVAWLPARWGRGGGEVARALALGALAAATLSMLARSDLHYRHKDVAIGEGADRMLSAGPRAELLARALERLEVEMGPDETLLVLPEGVGLNYWLRRRNPSRFDLFLPPEIAVFGEPAILADWEARPPDWIALVHRDGREFGAAPFGVDPRFGRGLLAWVRARYSPVARLGARPFRDEGFGIVLLRRKEALR